MSFLIRGGYNALHKTVTNIYLKETNNWKNGIILTDNNYFVGKVNPNINNKLNMIKGDDTHYLILNNNIIYENRMPITYNINLLSCSKAYNHGITDIGSFIIWDNICYSKIL